MLTEGEALAAFVAGRISFGALRNAIAGSTEFQFRPAGDIEIASRRPLPRTVVYPHDVHRILIRYRDGYLTAEEVSLWGLVLQSLEAFDVRASCEEDEDSIWDVIAQLSVASVNKAFTPDRVSELIEHMRQLSS